MMNNAQLNINMFEETAFLNFPSKIVSWKGDKQHTVKVIYWGKVLV